MSIDRRDALLDTGWSSAWDSLSETPDLVSRRKTAQIMLWLPSSLLDRIKIVADIRRLFIKGELPHPNHSIEAMVLLREAEEEREVADRELDRVLRELGLGGLRRA